MTAHPPAHPAYRPDIDGLRAIAVLAVIAFHANARLLPGGFVGVDIFFVISGYLITALIAKGIESKSFSFADFYARRIKRILPAYILVAVATLGVSSFLLIPNDYIFYTTSLAASWAFAANIFFSMLSWGYFGQRTEEFPLLHTWSLSVEEQFYFIFPILLLVLYRYWRKQMVAVLVVLGVAAVAISQLKTGEVRAYFLLTSRAHELIIGALTWFAVQRFALQSRALAMSLTLIGLVLILGSLEFIDRHTAFPGVNSLYPCMGAALVIFAGRVDNALTSCLSSKPLVFTGLISYSLYLWHWPIFSFLRYRGIEISWSVGAAAVTLAFSLAMLTWRFVEKPIRQSKKIQFRQAFTHLYAIPAMFFMCVGAYSYFTEGAPVRFSKDMRELISSYSFERDLGRVCAIRAEDYRKIDADYLEKNCAFGDENQAKASVLLFGDSHAHHFRPFVEQLAKNAHLKAVYHVQGGCMPTNLAGLSPRSSIHANNTEPSTCQNRNRDLLALASGYRYVAIAGFWADDTEGHEYIEPGMFALVAKITAAGAIPVIFKDNPSEEVDMSQCVLHRQRGWLPPETNCNVSYGAMSKAGNPSDQLIDRVRARYPEVIVIDPKKVMCNSAECLTHIGNIALYKDSNHINTKAAKLLAEQYIQKVGNPFGGSRADGTVAAVVVRK